MSEGMLIRCKKAATPTDSQSAIASPTHLTSPRVRDSQPATAPHLATTGTSIIVQNKEDENEHETPDLSTQLERAKRFGHNLSQVNVANKSAHLPTPAYPIAPKMIQCRLTIGQPGDKYEQEADRVAEQVMAMPAPPKPDQIQRQGSEQDEAETLQTKPLAASITPLIQRQAESTEEQEEQESLQTKPLAASITPLIQRQAESTEEQDEAETLQTKSQAEQDEEQVQLIPTRQQAAEGSSQTSSNIENQLKGSKGGGNPLPDSVRDFVEPRIGADFRGVRVHTDSTAVQMNRELNAQAFTHGQDIYFGAGKYEPGSSDGKRLLAHELTHVVQQTGAKQIQRQPINGLKSNKSTPALSYLPNSVLQLKPNLQPKLGSGKTTLDQKLKTTPAKTQNTQNSAAIAPAKPQNTQNPQSGSSSSNPTGGAQSGSNNKTSTEAEGTHKNAQNPHSGSSNTNPTGGAQSGSSNTNPTGSAQSGSSDKTSTEAEGTRSDEVSGLTATLSNLSPTAAPNSPDSSEVSTDGSSMEAPSDAASTKAVDAQSKNNAASPNVTGMKTPSNAIEQADKGNDGKQSPASAQEDSAFQSVVEQTKQVAANQQDHAPAETQSQQAQDAAQGPANEVESKAQDKQVQEMEQQQPGTFDAAAFKKALMDKIAEATPKNLEQADNFKNNNKIDEVKQEVSSQVTEQQKQAQEPIENKTKEKPNPSGIEPKPVTPLPPKQAGPKPPDVKAAKAAPKPKTASEVSLQAGSQSIDQKMDSAKITDEQLAKSNEPSFQSALEAKKEAQTHANTAPVAYRQQEQEIVSQAQDQAQTMAQKQLEEMHGTREQSLSQVGELQGTTKGKDEQERAKVANHIQEIYNNTKQKVDTCLGQLDGEVNKLFDDGAAAAQKLFEEYVGKRMEAYKAERYSGFWGAGKWLIDKLFGMPSEVNQFYEEGKQQYLASMDGTIDQIANLVANKLNEAKAEIAKGKQEIQNYVTTLPESLQQVGQEAAQNIQGKFDELEQTVNSKQDELIDNLAQKYNDNLQQLNSRIEEMKEENKGLVQKAVEFVVGVVKTIAELAKLLLQALVRAASAIPKILADPIGFVKNLVNGLKQGFENFVKNIGQHLSQGLLNWLTGTLAGTGIEMPESLDSQGIFSLVAQVLGLGYEAIRDRAVDRFGEEKVGHLEQSFDMFRILATQGIIGLWEFVKDRVGDLKSMVLDAIEQFVIQQVIQQGITWLLSMLNPASAFVRACKAVYDIVVFFMDRAQQIADLINAIVDSIIAIANGSAIAEVAKLIENALAKAIPVAIGFLASLLGLGGLAERVQGIINKARKPFDQAIEWVFQQAAKVVGDEDGESENTRTGNKGRGKKGTDRKQDANQDESPTPKSASSAPTSTKKQDADKVESSTPKSASSASTPPKKQDANQAKSPTSQPSASSTPKSESSKSATKPPKSKSPASSSPNQDKHRDKDGKPDKASTKEKGKEDNRTQNNKGKDRQPDEDKKKDLAAAEKKLRKIISKSESTKEVEQHFPTVKKQFRLKKLEWNKLGTSSAAIIMEINPKAKIDLSGTKLMLMDTEGKKHNQEVTFETKMIDSKYLAGKKMEAKKLGPNHPQGDSPLGGALNTLMKKLPTQPKGVTDDKKYVKGHLLNDNLGGPGSAQNLYPITADANKKHEARVERLVKNWVNNEGYWVYYKVEVANENIQRENGDIKAVNADFVCEASRLDADGKKSFEGAIKTTIHSELNQKKNHTEQKINKDEYSDKDPEKDSSFDKDKVELASGKERKKGKRKKDEDVDSSSPTKRQRKK
ncbi:MAG TPA: DUF4157 domain-containing protein [Leptolyngbyaceae cyanobacterium]